MPIIILHPISCIITRLPLQGEAFVVFKTKADADKMLAMQTLKMGEDEVTLMSMYAYINKPMFYFFLSLFFSFNLSIYISFSFISPPPYTLSINYYSGKATMQSVRRSRRSNRKSSSEFRRRRSRLRMTELV